MPLSMFAEGSYFGDTDFLLSKQPIRQYTAICQLNCQLYSFTKNQYDSIMSRYPKISQSMKAITREKENYFELIKQELQIKYTKKTVLETLYSKIKDDEWTSYMSLKRQLIKKNDSKRIKARGNITSKQAIEERKKLKRLASEAKNKIKANKFLARSLGQRSLNSLHLEKYSQQLKDTINIINEQQAKSKLQNANAIHEVTEQSVNGEDFEKKLLNDMRKFN